jgi:hypothetical protein
MKTRLKFHLTGCILIFLFCHIHSTEIFAQTAEPTKVKITVSIEELGYQDIKDKKKFKSVWKFYRGPKPVEDLVMTNNYKNQTCFEYKSRKNNKTKEIGDEKDEFRQFEAPISGFWITMETFVNKKGGEKCMADQKDAHYALSPRNIPLDNLAINVWSDEYKIIDPFGLFFATIKYKYELLNGLDIIEFSGTERVIDANKPVTLNLPIKIANKETMPFTWKYAKGDTENWKIINTSGKDNSSITINPLQDIFGGKLSKPEKINFKAEVSNDNKTETSDMLTLTFVPSPPVFNKEKDLVLIPVCNGQANGGIEIKNIKASTAEIQYVLQKKSESAEPCNPSAKSPEECPGFIHADTIPVNSPLRIRNLAKGEYYLYNGDLESGEVNNATPFTITALSPFKDIDMNPAYKDPTCNNEMGGEIYMNVEGAENLWQIVIIPNKGKINRDGNSISFKELEAGKYTVNLYDRCGTELVRNFTLKKPKMISIDRKTILPKQDKTDFYIQLTIQNGSNDYKIKITDQENNTSEMSSILDPEIPISKAGIYDVEVIDNTNPACQPAKVKIKVDKSPKPKSAKFTIKVVDE